MTEPAPPPIADGQDPRRASRPRAQAPIVPRATVAGRALIVVVAIMTFLASLTVGTVVAVRKTATAWRGDVGRELTIQVRAGDPALVEPQVRAAQTLALHTPGIASVQVLTPADTSRLLEPWLGTGLDYSDLPVPRILVLRIDPEHPPDLALLRRTLTDRIPTASLDDHRGWSRRLGALAEGVMLTGLVLLILVGIATVLCVVFATRAAVATNRPVVEVLHIVGARDRFIAAQFQRHFLKIGTLGGLIGAGAAGGLFLTIAALPRLGLGSDPETPSILSWLAPGLPGFGAIALTMALVALATAITSRVTVYRTLRAIQ